MLKMMRPTAQKQMLQIRKTQRLILEILRQLIRLLIRLRQILEILRPLIHQRLILEILRPLIRQLIHPLIHQLIHQRKRVRMIHHAQSRATDCLQFIF